MSGRKGREPGLDSLYEAAGERPGEQRALIVLGVVGVALALILSAFFVGRELSAGSDDDSAEPAPASSEIIVGGGNPDNVAEAALGAPVRPPKADGPKIPTKAPPKRNPPRGKLIGKPYRGAISTIRPVSASATCRAPDGVDAGGKKVRYVADNMLDRKRATAWRCNGAGRGVTLVIRLGGRTEVASVGLVPGYAKTDPVDNTNRYRENRRISKVRWTFGNGAWIEQRFNTSPNDRSLQTMRIPAVKTGKVSITIKGSVKARRNTIAISTVRLGSPRR
ncbi:MAG: hypothetical protein GEU93_15240 [Propionibacteriales bacterium]|nr:hypothetical protein [Propionibacteriales bacterium]